MTDLVASNLEARSDIKSSREGLGAATAGAATRLTPAKERLGDSDYGDRWISRSWRIQSRGSMGPISQVRNVRFYNISRIFPGVLEAPAQSGGRHTMVALSHLQDCSLDIITHAVWQESDHKKKAVPREILPRLMWVRRWYISKKCTLIGVHWGDREVHIWIWAGPGRTEPKEYRVEGMTPSSDQSRPSIK